jgi:hypothetical protein
MKSYEKLLNVPIVPVYRSNQDWHAIYTKSKTFVANGYIRIVLGGRGPYMEFSEVQIILSSFYIPRDQLYRLTDLRIYYVEMRSNDSAYVKLYYQKKTVAYADYKIGMFYMSPKDLCLADGSPIIRDKIDEKSEEFFE